MPQTGIITPDVFRDWPLPLTLPAPAEGERGRTLIVAGSAQRPGAAILAALAALRTGAGPLCIATARSVSATVGLAVPESRVIGLRETPRGGLARLAPGARTRAFAAMLVGPGMQDPEATARLVQGLRARFPQAMLQLDACAIAALESETVPWDRFNEGQVLITPEADELARLTGSSLQDVAANGAGVARKAARQWRVTVLLKGARSHVATPTGQVWSQPPGGPVHGASGAGTVLSGIIAGLLARGCSPEQGAVWGLALHSAASEVLAQRIGPVGYLARELPEQIPGLLFRAAAAGVAARQPHRSTR